MKLEVSSFYAKVNANMETFEKRLKVNMALVAYFLSLHWFILENRKKMVNVKKKPNLFKSMTKSCTCGTKSYKSKTKVLLPLIFSLISFSNNNLPALTEELQQAREAQAMLTTQLDDYENRITDLRYTFLFNQLL